jgi:uncharacterized phage protein gp47/JayE
MPLSLFDVQTPLSRESVRELLIALLKAADFPVDSWQDESAARAFLELAAQLGAEQSKPVALLAKMPFLPTAEADFLDAKVKSDYDEERSAAVATVMPVRLVNDSGTTYSKGARTIILTSRTGRTYSNVAGVSVTANDETTSDFEAEVAGAAGNVPAQTMQLTTPMAGVTAIFDGAFTTAGADAESDPNLRTRASSKWATLRTEKINAGILNLVRSAAPNLVGVSIDDENPRGAGTVDVYLAGENATAGSGDVDAVQDALDGALFGTGTEEPAGLAIAAPTQVLDIEVTVYVRGVTAEAAQSALLLAWQDFLTTVPVGGFDLSPGPQNVILPGQITDVLGDVDGVVSSALTTPALGADEPIAVSPHTKVLEGASTFNVIVLSSS